MNLLSRAIFACGVTASMGVSPAVAIQAPFQIAALTVPGRFLPTGCRLAPLVDSNGNRSFAAYPGVRENPWIGTGAPAALIRDFVDGRPLNSEEQSRSKRLVAKAEGLAEAYRAVYLAGNSSKVDVYAVRFEDPALTARASLSKLGDQTRRVIVIRSTAVVISTERGGNCFEAVSKYIASIR